jgi:hypothetical protein
MDGVVAACRRWFGPPVRDAIIVVVVTAILVFGSYGEGNPSSPSDRIQFLGHAAPQPGAALILVAIAGLALLWRRRAPVAVLVVTVAAASVYSLLGLVNGAILIAPILALYSVASQVSLRRAFIAAVATLAILMTVTAANNPFGHISGGGFDIIPFMVAAALFAGIAVANRNAYVASIRDRAEQDARRRLDEERLPAAQRPGAGRADRTGARGAGAGGRGPVQRRDRRPAVPVSADRQDSRQPHHDEAERARPRPARRDRLRERPGHPRRPPLAPAAASNRQPAASR